MNSHADHALCKSISYLVLKTILTRHPLFPGNCSSKEIVDLRQVCQSCISKYIAFLNFYNCLFKLFRIVKSIESWVSNSLDRAFKLLEFEIWYFFCGEGYENDWHFRLVKVLSMIHINSVFWLEEQITNLYNLEDTWSQLLVQQACGVG